MRALTLRIATWTTVGGAVIAALSLGTVDHSRHGWLGKSSMASTFILPTAPTQAGIVTFVHAAAPPAAPASAARLEARRPLR